MQLESKGTKATSNGRGYWTPVLVKINLIVLMPDAFSIRCTQCWFICISESLKLNCFTKNNKKCQTYWKRLLLILKKNHPKKYFKKIDYFFSRKKIFSFQDYLWINIEILFQVCLVGMCTSLGRFCVKFSISVTISKNVTQKITLREQGRVWNGW